jgi:ribosome hibernation promoting factor
MSNTMETTFTFRNIDTTDALREHTLDKLTKLNKYLLSPATTHVIFNVEGGGQHTAEITLNVKGERYVGHDVSNDLYSSIDGAVDKVKNQLSRDKDRKKGHKGE